MPPTSPPELRKAWGASVRRRREELCITQADLAIAVDVRAPAISQIETGRQAPSDITKVRLARALDTTVAELFPYDVLEQAS